MARVCEICGRPYGDCDYNVHQRLMKPGYIFITADPVETTDFASSVTPRLGQPTLDKDGKPVAKVAKIVYRGK